MDAIRLHGLAFHALIGDLPHEREIPQPLEVDVEVETDVRPAARSDRLEDALDYRRLYQAVAAAVAADEAPHLLETLAQRIAERLLEIERVQRARVRCRKPHAALPGPVGRVEVEVERP